MGVETKIEWCDHDFRPWRIKGGKRVVAAEKAWGEPLKWNRLGAENRDQPKKHVCTQCGTRYFCSFGASAECNWKCNVVLYRPRVFCASLDVFENWQGRIANSRGLDLCRNEAGYWYPEGAPAELPNADDWGQRELTMGDLRRRLFRLIDATPNIDWLLSTKHPENVRRMWPVKQDARPIFSGMPGPLGQPVPCVVTGAHRSNVWLLTSMSDQPTADAMIPELLKCRDLVPALGVSAEPLVGPVDFTPYIGGRSYQCQCGFHATETELVFTGGDRYSCTECGQLCKIGPTLDWVIVGGESGPKARPCDIGWVRSIVTQCKAAGVPCFVKQLGANPHYTNHQGDMHACGPFRDPKGGDWNEWPEDLRVREWPKGGE